MAQDQGYFEGIGRRKTATARVRIYKGNKPSTVNGKPVGEYFDIPGHREFVMEPLKVLGLEKKYYFTAKVQGGGVTGHKGSVQLGLSRALYDMNPDNKPPLRKADLVTRDPRMVERKKYNQKGARAKNQFSKR